MVGKLLRKGLRVVSLDLLQMPLGIDDPVEPDSIAPEQPGDILLRPIGRGVDPDIISHALEGVDQIRSAQTESVFIDPVQREPELRFRLMCAWRHEQDFIQIEGNTHLHDLRLLLLHPVKDIYHGGRPFRRTCGDGVFFEFP